MADADAGLLNEHAEAVERGAAGRGGGLSRAVAGGFGITSATVSAGRSVLRSRSGSAPPSGYRPTDVALTRMPASAGIRYGPVHGT